METSSFNPANRLLSWIVGPAALVPNTRYLHNWRFPGIVPERLGDELQEIINNKSIPRGSFLVTPKDLSLIMPRD